MTLSALVPPFPRPLFDIPSSLHCPTDWRGLTRSIPPNQPNGTAEFIPSCNKKGPEEPQRPLEEKWCEGQGLGVGELFTEPPQPCRARSAAHNAANLMGSNNCFLSVGIRGDSSEGAKAHRLRCRVLSTTTDTAQLPTTEQHAQVQKFGVEICSD